MTQLPADHEFLDPFESHAQRAPMTDAGVSVLVFDAGKRERAADIASGLQSLLETRGRASAARVLSTNSERGLGPTLDAALSECTLPLVLVTHAIAPWTDAHLDPMLHVIDHADHVVGRRAAEWPHRLRRRLSCISLATLYALPISDIHSPCRLHRLEALARIPLESETSYVNIEMLAKATFLAQLIQEVDVPALPADERVVSHTEWAHDRRVMWRRPLLARTATSGPAKDAQGDQERDGGPSNQD